MKYFTPTKLSENIQETPEGFLVCLGVPIARTGWQVYAPGEVPIDPGEDGKIHVYRDPADVFHPDTIASFEGKALTIEHPMDFVTPLNWSDLAKGMLQNVRKSSERDQDGEESLLADVLVTDVVAIQLVKAGLREVSCGYDAVYEPTDPGKAKQTAIIGNHLALVKEGRAGPGYAIHDHKTERFKGMSKLAEKVKQLFSKAMDEAAAESSEKADGSISYDEMVKMVKDLDAKIDGFMKGKDEAPVKESEEKAEQKDESKEPAVDAEVSSGIEERLKKLEEALAKLMQSESSEAMGDQGDPEEVGDADKEDKEDKSMTGDTAARAEILSPGIQLSKDVKAKSLKNAYGTKEGKSVIDSLTGGKSPTFDSEDSVSNLFIAASEILKVKRGTGLEGTKSKTSDHSGATSTATYATAEYLNEVNKAFWANRK